MREAPLLRPRRVILSAVELFRRLRGKSAELARRNLGGRDGKDFAVVESTKMRSICLRIATRDALQDPVPLARFALCAKFDYAIAPLRVTR